MKKLIFASLTIASVALATNAEVNMIVEKLDGNIVKYNVDSLSQVYFEVITAPDSVLQGVSVTGKVNGNTYVDLGLESGTLWATYNVGSEMPVEFGSYFAWGETVARDEFTKSNYLLADGSVYSHTKYCVDEEWGTVDSKTMLEKEDDAATANWGNGWRMPTVVEQQELVNGCQWSIVDDFNGTGVGGHVGVSRYNGRTIFFPFVGKKDPKLMLTENRGDYWSSSLDKRKSDCAWYFGLEKGATKSFGYGSRFVGRAVRAVVAAK